MPAIETITIKGFKSLAAIEALPLGPINILIGANGAGKSNFLEVFELVRAIADDRLDWYVGRADGANRLLTFGAKRTPSMELKLTFDAGSAWFDYKLAANVTNRLFVERADFAQPDQQLAPSHPLAALLKTLRVYHFHDTTSASALKRTCDLNHNRQLDHDGGNLPAILYALQQTNQPVYEMICETVQLVTPFFKEFVLEPQKLNPQTIRLAWRHQNSDEILDVSAFSDGTLRFIALATLLLDPTGKVILVDEPELGLHPVAISILAGLIRHASATKQLILATQSSHLLDEFEPADLIVADLVQGVTQLKRVESQPLEVWLQDFSLGQLWEKNEFGGRPGAATVHG